jgi:myosin heavy subunit
MVIVYNIQSTVYNKWSRVYNIQLWQVVAAIIHLGNLDFIEGVETESSAIRDQGLLKTCARLLQVKPAELSAALVQQVVAARGDVVAKRHDIPAALYTRDALAKVVKRDTSR